MAARCIQVTAMLLAMLASISLGLGVANVIAVYYLIYNVTSFNCQSTGSQSGIDTTAQCPYRTIITLAFIGSGIWGSLVVFVLSIMAIRLVAKQMPYRTIFMTATFVTVVVIIPAMIVLNAVNAILTTDEYSSPASQPIFNVTAFFTNTASQYLLFGLPVAVSAVGAMEFLLMSLLIMYTCFFFREKKPSKEPTAAQPKKGKHSKTPSTSAATPAPAPAPDPAPAPAPAQPPAPVVVGPPAPSGFGPGLAYSPYGYGPLPYRRPLAYGVADYGKVDPTSFYRPALRTPYAYPPAAGYNRYPAARPAPLSYNLPY